MPLPAAARAVDAATRDAVAAAQAQDVAGFEDAVNRLAAAEPEHVRLVLGAVVRDLLEDLFPDGLAADDLLDLIKAAARRAFAWYPSIDVEALVVVLTGALGVHEPDEEPRRWTPLEVARHAPLFVTELLAQPATHRTLPDYLAQAFARRQQAELNEMP
jgi:hypothetical protein